MNNFKAQKINNKKNRATLLTTKFVTYQTDIDFNMDFGCVTLRNL